MCSIRHLPECCAAITGSYMGLHGVPMGGSLPVVDGTIPCGCGTRTRKSVCRSCRLPMASLPSSKALHGVLMGDCLPVGAISREYRYGRCSQETACGLIVRNQAKCGVSRGVPMVPTWRVGEIMGAFSYG